MTEIDIAKIQGGKAQMRVEMRPETIQDYAEDMHKGNVFPPVVVYFDGETYWLADGFHRVEAAKKITCKTINADVRSGNERDAIVHGMGSNADHGLRRTQADKRRAIETALRDPEWAQWSDRRISEVCKVDHKTVGKVRRELTGGGEIPKPKERAGGEIPTPSEKAGEIPKPNGMPNSVKASMLKSLPDKDITAEFLRRELAASLANDIMIAECRRRGLVVSDA